MRQLENINLPDDLFMQVEDRAREHQRSIAEEIATCVAKALEADDVETVLLTGIREERGQYARKGVFIADEDIKSALDWGRK